MALVDDFLDLLHTKYKPGQGEFYRLKAEVFIEEMKIREKGQERGARNQPPADSTDLDVIEQNIVEAMRQTALDDERRAREQMDHYTNQIRNLHPAGGATPMFLEAQEAVAGFEKAMLSARAILEQERKGVIERERQVVDFKADHGLRRPPDPPLGHWLMIFLLSLYLVGEIAINASVLSEGSDYGIIGGVVGAFFYTVTSMSLAFILGFFALPFLSHRKVYWKVAGFLVSVALIGLILFVNLLAAHYRIAITADLGELEALRRAPATLLADPWHFMSDMKSILMVCVSLVVAFATCIKGLYWRDSYPGYARVAAFRQRAHSRWIHALGDHGDELEDIYKHHADKIRSLQLSLTQRQELLPEKINHRRRLAETFNDQLNHIEDVGNLMLTSYREANAETRQSPAPKYFKRKWKLDAVQSMTLPDGSDAGDPKTWSNAGAELLAASKALHAAHAEAVRWIKQLSATESAVHADAAIARKQQEEASPGEGSQKKAPTLQVVEGERIHDAQA